MGSTACSSNRHRDQTRSRLPNWVAVVILITSAVSSETSNTTLTVDLAISIEERKRAA